MTSVELTIVAEHAQESELQKFVDELQKLKDLPSTKIDISKRTATALELKLRYPLSMFDRSVGQFMAVLFGEIPYMRSFGKARFEDLRLPDEVYEWFHGPTFGAESVLDRFGASPPPMLLAILKPSLDLNSTLEELEQRIAGPIAGGFHAAKDDETQGDFPNLPLSTRLDLAARNPSYIPALNLDDSLALRTACSDSRIRMVIINPTILGFPTLHELSKVTKVPLLAHLSMQGIYANSFSLGLFAQLHRLFGSDAFITPIGETHYYRATKKDEMEMVSTFTSDLPIHKTLPMLTGGGRMDNLGQIMEPYHSNKVPYGIVLGGLIFGSEGTPREMASAVVRRIEEIKSKTQDHPR